MKIDLNNFFIYLLELKKEECHNRNNIYNIYMSIIAIACNKSFE